MYSSKVISDSQVIEGQELQTQERTTEVISGIQLKKKWKFVRRGW
jgi:hypothetical protein